MVFVMLLALISMATAEVAPQRKVMAWARADAIDQITNESWAGIFDGVQALCGVQVTVSDSSAVLDVNESAMAACDPLKQALKASGSKFHVWIGGIPPEALADPDPFLRSALTIAQRHSIEGFSVDDEYDCAPRSTLANFTDWMNFMNVFGEMLHKHSIELSAAVQAMFGIQDVPYAPLCDPPENPACSQACHSGPSAYPFEPRVAAFMSKSNVDRWLEMDTYYFGTGRFLNALDWYTQNVALEKIGIAVMNRDDISPDGYLARFHAIDRSGADWINLFMLPARDEWLPFLRRWKSRCAGCPNQHLLSCYDLTVDCDEASIREVVA